MMSMPRPPQPATINEQHVSNSPDETYSLGLAIGRRLIAGDLVLLQGQLGAGKTLLTKGILEALGFDPDEVTSPSFTLVNLYRASKCDVYHIDLWRMDETNDVASALGIGEILEDENAVIVIEWAEKLRSMQNRRRVVKIHVAGDGDDPRKFHIEWTQA